MLGCDCCILLVEFSNLQCWGLSLSDLYTCCCARRGVMGQGYFATPDEYDIGGYESQLTFWGIDTAALVAAGCQTVATVVRP